ncbi:MAG: FeoB-associated Cys-rich membrane protein [Eubacterium sp.]|nr:FeoB-associated Cys-rich membrane protein [Candidatus Colimonas fimequi]
MFATIVSTLALVVIVFLAARYIIKKKKQGVKCIGCPVSGKSDCQCNDSYAEEFLAEYYAKKIDE